jgi:uncharacterized protein YbbK (DUF523 family)
MAQSTAWSLRSNMDVVGLLKANSPSCGNRHIYDGSFTGQLQPGEGVVSSLLRQHNIRIQ